MENQQNGGLEGKRPLIIGSMFLAIVIISFFALVYPPPTDETVHGTLGRTPRLESALPVEVQEILQNEEYRELIQSDDFQRMLSNHTFRELSKEAHFSKLLTDSTFQRIISDSAFVDLLHEPGFQKLMADESLELLKADTR